MGTAAAAAEATVAGMVIVVSSFRGCRNASDRIIYPVVWVSACVIEGMACFRT